MKQILHMALFVGYASLMTAQHGVPFAAGARGAAMANASVTFNDLNSAFSNPAGLTGVESIAFTAMAEQRFLLAELRALSAAAVLPSRSGVFGVNVQYFGFEAFNQQKLGVMYARRLWEDLSIGAQLSVLNTNVLEYGSQANVSFELGFITKLLPTLQLGAHVINPARIALLPDENLPTLLRLGLAYAPSAYVTCTAEVEKDLDFPARTKFGIEYRPAAAIQLRTGVATNPTNIAFGAGYRLSNGLQFDVASVYHQMLGFTPTVSLNFQKPIPTF